MKKTYLKDKTMVFNFRITESQYELINRESFDKEITKTAYLRMKLFS